MTISPDQTVWFEFGFIRISSTLLFAWLVMVLLVLLARWITRRLATDATLSPWQNLRGAGRGHSGQIRDIARRDSVPYLPFVGTLFVFIATSNLLAVVPGFEAAHRLVVHHHRAGAGVLVAVPLFGIRRRGWRAYLRDYLEPTRSCCP